MGEKKAKITLSGIGKGGSSNAFMSFRFSPDSEEIQEIIQDDPAIDTRLSESAPASPKPPTPGDVSPLKEYLLKEKHKWTNKWDKKSLSLDLDLKGKIKTAIEDRTKSILSNFIPEETGVIHQSQSIPENFTTRVYSSTTSEEQNSQSSSSSSGDLKRSKLGSLNNHLSNDSSGNGSQETLDGESSDGFRAALDVEEIGIDMTDYRGVDLLHPDSEEYSMIEGMIQFQLPASDLQETFEHLPTLYQPLSLITGIRVTPLELSGQLVDANKTTTTSLPHSSNASNGSVSSLDSVESESAEFGRKRINFLIDNHLSVILRNIIKDIVYQPCTKWWICVCAMTYMLSWNILWFLLGIITFYIVHNGVTSSPEALHVKGKTIKERTRPVGYNLMPGPRDFKVPVKCQGWMTEMEGEYDVNTCHFKLTRVVFVRIDRHNLYLFYPHPKNRVPKRRLWNDPVIDTAHLFDRQKVYDISGAKIELKPFGIARKRSWNKKYPIAITFPKFSVFHVATPQHDSSVESFRPKESNTNTTVATTSVNYKASTAGVSLISGQGDKDRPKDIVRQDCGSKTIYLFARTDREKDDWYRRFVNSSNQGPLSASYHSATIDHTAEYREYMERICPSLVPFIHSNIADGYDNISLMGERDAQLNKSVKNTPGTSKTPTPDKDVTTSDIERIITIPESPKFLNTLLGRTFFDFLKSPYWIGVVQNLIDKKLFYMKKPPFIEEIRVKALDLGNRIPLITRASPPIMDYQGLWVDLDLIYDGNFNVSLETHVNFLKLIPAKKSGIDAHNEQPGPSTASGSGNTSGGSKKSTDNGGSSSSSPVPPKDNGSSGSPTANHVPLTAKQSRVFDADADDSGESSEEEQDSEYDNATSSNAATSSNNPTNHELHYSDPNVPTKSHKFMKFSERIVNSTLMNRTIVKNLVSSVASKPLVLAVELRSIIGTLTVNIPPPPNDRIWIGFRTNPNMELVALPLKFGETNINISQVTEWIRKKLLLEFQRTVVCPNMVDITIPLMEFGLPK